MSFLLTLLGLFLIPAICFAHSGTIFNAVSNYLPFLFPFISGFVIAFRKFFAKYLRFFKRKGSDGV